MSRFSKRIIVFFFRLCYYIFVAHFVFLRKVGGEKMNIARHLPGARGTHSLRRKLSELIRAIREFILGNTVAVIATVAAAVTSVIVPPDAEYLSYIDFKTISCLFATLAVICALRNIRFFTFVARKIVSLTGNLRAASIALVYITFIGSMLIANDMALLTFLPLGHTVMKETGQRKYTAYVFVLQNIAANLGGMLTPFGNPQNLFLYSNFSIPTLEFMGIMLPHFLIAIALVTVCAALLPGKKLTLSENSSSSLPAGRTVIYGVLFFLAIASVFNVIPYYIAAAVMVAAFLILDRDALAKVDYPLLITFVMFFIFAGNMSRIGAVEMLFSYLLEKGTMVFSILSCQVISNVPSAILLSRFTDNYSALLIGVNIGGTGTLIASLASLITFREYTKENPHGAGKYMLIFTGMNLLFLAVLTGAALLMGYR